MEKTVGRVLSGTQISKELTGLREGNYEGVYTCGSKLTDHNVPQPNTLPYDGPPRQVNVYGTDPQLFGRSYRLNPRSAGYHP